MGRFFKKLFSWFGPSNTNQEDTTILDVTAKPKLYDQTQRRLNKIYYEDENEPAEELMLRRIIDKTHIISEYSNDSLMKDRVLKQTSKSDLLLQNQTYIANPITSKTIKQVHLLLLPVLLLLH